MWCLPKLMALEGQVRKGLPLVDMCCVKGVGAESGVGAISTFGHVYVSFSR